MPSVCDGGNIEPFVMQIAEIEVLLCPWGIGEINLGPILIILNIYIYIYMIILGPIGPQILII